MLCLLRRRCNVVFPLCRELFRRRVRCRSAHRTIKAGIAPAIYRNGLAVNVRDRNVGEIVHCAVVEEAAVLPVAAFVTGAIIAAVQAAAQAATADLIWAAFLIDVSPFDLRPSRPTSS